MPELPEVEVVRQGLAPLVTGRTILAIATSRKKLRKTFPRAKMEEFAKGATILAVTRRAKYLLLHLSSKALMVFHLGMTGKLGLFPPEGPAKKHDHLRFLLDNGKEMRFHDVRRFGFAELFTAEELARHEPFAELGPEPFAEEFSAEYLFEKAGRKRVPVKGYLMDNRVVVGLGNIYANETLFAAGIHPETPANMVQKREWQRIVTASRAILTKAIAMGGSTISDYENASGKPGYFQLELAVYGRDGKPCPRCRQAIQRIVLGGRATFFCPRCQRERARLRD